eukprot:IDg23146t1
MVGKVCTASNNPLLTSESSAAVLLVNVQGRIKPPVLGDFRVRNRTLNVSTRNGASLTRDVFFNYSANKASGSTGMKTASNKRHAIIVMKTGVTPIPRLLRICPHCNERISMQRSIGPLHRTASDNKSLSLTKTILIHKRMPRQSIHTLYAGQGCRYALLSPQDPSAIPCAPFSRIAPNLWQTIAINKSTKLLWLSQHARSSHIACLLVRKHIPQPDSIASKLVHAAL